MKKMTRNALFFLLIQGFLPLYGQGFSGGGAPYENRSSESAATEKTFTFELNYFSFPELEEQLSEMEPGLFRNHPLEKEVAIRLQLFEETYAHYSEPAPGALTGSKVISKPVIYQAVYRIDREFRKRARSAEINTHDIVTRFCRILDTALILYHYDSGELEEALRSAESVDDMILLFSQVRMISIHQPIN